MKKTSFPMFLSTAIVCYLFWLLISGQLASWISGSATSGETNQILVAGAFVALGAALFSAKFFIHESPFYLFNPVKLIILAFYCLVIFMIELFKANVDVAFRALNPKLPLNPGIVKVPVKLKSEYGKSMLANSITLTPGTITMDTVEQDGQDYYYIHCVDVPSEDPVEAGDAIKGTLEKWVGRIWK